MNPFGMGMGESVTMPQDIQEIAKDAGLDEPVAVKVFLAGYEDGREGKDRAEFDLPSIQDIYNGGHERGAHALYVYQSLEGRHGETKGDPPFPGEEVEENKEEIGKLHRYFDKWCAFAYQHEVGMVGITEGIKTVAMCAIAVALLRRR